MTRGTTLRQRLAERLPDLLADLYLYPTDQGGKTLPVVLGYGCPCSVDKDVQEAWDGYPLVENPMLPGESRRVGFVFLSGEEAVEALSKSDCFYLWERQAHRRSSDNRLGSFFNRMFPIALKTTPPAPHAAT